MRIYRWILTAVIITFLIPSFVQAVEPRAYMTYEPEKPRKGEMVTFDASYSYAIKGHVSRYYIDFGDGSNSSWVFTAKITHIYKDAGEYCATLRVIDDSGVMSKNYTVQIYVLEQNKPPVACITTDVKSLPKNSEIIVYLSDSYDPDGYVKFYKLDFGDGTSTGWTDSPVHRHKYTSEGTFVMRLIVKDDESAVSQVVTYEVEVTAEEPFSKEFAFLLFIFLGAVILVGFIGNYLFKKFGIPDIISLIILGILVGPTFRLLDVTLVSKFVYVIGSLALMILLFDGGLNLPLRKVITEGKRGAFLGVLSFTTTVIVVGYVTSIMIFGGEILYGILLATIIGGTSGAIVMPLVMKMDVDDDTKTIVSIESTVTDVLCIVSFIAVIQMISPMEMREIEASEIANQILGAFSIGILLGGIAGVFWVWVLKKIEKIEYGFMLTIAAVFCIYSLSEWAGGSGPLSALIFGLVLSSGDAIGKIFQLKEAMQITNEMRQFHSEISFFIKSFFFVYMGLIFAIRDITMVFYGILLVCLIVVARFIAVAIGTVKTPQQKRMGLLTILLPRGLAAAVLAMLPGLYHVPNATVYTDIAFVTIIGTVIVTTVGVPISIKKKNETFANQDKRKDEEENEEKTNGKKGEISEGDTYAKFELPPPEDNDVDWE